MNACTWAAATIALIITLPIGGFLIAGLCAAASRGDDLMAIAGTTKDTPAQASPPTPGPTPPPPHNTGGVDYTIRVWRCGCIRLWDGHGRITGVTACDPPGTVSDEEIKDFLS